MASGVITLPDEFIPKLVEQLSEYGEKAFVVSDIYCHHGFSVI